MAWGHSDWYLTPGTEWGGWQIKKAKDLKQMVSRGTASCPRHHLNQEPTVTREGRRAAPGTGRTCCPWASWPCSAGPRGSWPAGEPGSCGRRRGGWRPPGWWGRWWWPRGAAGGPPGSSCWCSSGRRWWRGSCWCCCGSPPTGWWPRAPGPRCAQRWDLLLNTEENTQCTSV